MTGSTNNLLVCAVVKGWGGQGYSSRKDERYTSCDDPTLLYNMCCGITEHVVDYGHLLVSWHTWDNLCP
jgi:hypothetical protein